MAAKTHIMHKDFIGYGMWVLIEARQFGDITSWDFGCDQVSQSVGCVIASEAFFIGIGFKDVGRVIRIVLKVRKRFEQSGAALVNEESRFNAGVGIAEAV